MKIVTVTLGVDGSPVTPGWLILNYEAKEGGRTNIGAKIVANPDGSLPTWAEVAVLLNSNMGRPQWPSFVKHIASGNAVRLSLPDEMDATVFYAEFTDPDQSTLQVRSPPFVEIAEEKFG